MRNPPRPAARRRFAPLQILFSPFRWLARGLAAFFSRFRDFFTFEPEDTPLPDTLAKAVSNPTDVLVHLDALRKHLLRAVIFFAITTALSFAFTEQLIDLLAIPVGGIDKLQAIEVTESLGTFMRVALLSGFAFALPYIAFELWWFAAEGLRPRARVMTLFSIPSVAIFFIGGMLFSYFAMIPTALRFLLDFMGVNTVPRLSSYISFVTGLMFWVGVAFEFPLVIFILAFMGFINSSILIKQWRLAIVIIAVVSAVITPTVDPVSMSLVMGPMILLFFLSIGLAAIARRLRG